MGVLVRLVSVASVLLFLSANSYAQSANPFFVPPTYPGSGQTVTADFNGDGKPDLIFADGTVLLGKGDGTFTVGTPLGVAGLNASTSIAMADFNGDGKPDLVVSGALNTFIVLLGNGDGTFQAPISTSVSSPLYYLAAADLNGDGKGDVIAASLSTPSVFVTYLGKGDGTFLPGVMSGALSQGQLADFNGDGKLDLLPVIGTGVQLGNGDGTFGPLLAFPASFSGGVAGDFNGDGKLDVFGSNLSVTGSIEVVFGNGDGTFTAGPVQTLPSGTFGSDPTVADLNNDGKTDLVLAGSAAVQVFKSNGDGTFSIGKPYNTENQFNQFGVASSSIIVADFNGDGKLDVAAFNTLLLGNGDGTLQGDEVIVGLSGFVGVTGDFKKDGHPDIALVRGSGGTSKDLDIWLNDGKANFTLAHTYQIPTPMQLSGATLAGVADLNGDGNLDLVGYVNSKLSWNVVVLLGNGDGSFGAPITSSGGSGGLNLPGFTLADLNGDGKPDLMVVAVGAGTGPLNVLLNNGDGTFAAPVQYFAESANGNVVTGDFNKDGKLDAVVGTASDGIAVLLGNGDGTFQPTTFITSTACGNACQYLATADVNQDGNADLIVSIPTGFQVLLGKGDGSFTALPAASNTVGGNILNNPSSGNLQIADFNGDGKVDLLGNFGVSGSALLALVLGNGDGTFGSPLPLTIPAANFVADFNGDGRPDIFALISGGVVSLFNTTTPGFQITASSLSATTIAPGGSATATVTLTPQGGFNGNIVLSCTGLPVGASCIFAPASIPTGSGTSTLTITTTAATLAKMYSVGVVGTSGGLTHQISIALTVAAADFSLTPGSSTATVAPGQTATYVLSLTASSGFSPMVTLTCTGAPTGAACSIAPTTVSLSGTTGATATVTVTTTAASQVWLPGGSNGSRRIKMMLLFIYVTAVLAIASLYRLRANPQVRWAPVLAMTLLLCVGLMVTSCGGGSSGGGGTVVTGTQAGTYTIAVSASAPAGSTTLSHATKLTLVVQ